MNIIPGITSALAPMGLPAPVGHYDPPDGHYPDEYIVITPLDERNDDVADDAALTETSAADINLYIRGSYYARAKQAKGLLEAAGLYLSFRGYVSYEKDTKHHHYVITVEEKEVV